MKGTPLKTEHDRVLFPATHSAICVGLVLRRAPAYCAGIYNPRICHAMRCISTGRPPLAADGLAAPPFIFFPEKKKNERECRGFYTAVILLVRSEL